MLPIRLLATHFHSLRMQGIGGYIKDSLDIVSWKLFCFFDFNGLYFDYTSASYSSTFKIKKPIIATLICPFTDSPWTAFSTRLLFLTIWFWCLLSPWLFLFVCLFFAHFFLFLAHTLWLQEIFLAFQCLYQYILLIFPKTPWIMSHIACSIPKLQCTNFKIQELKLGPINITTNLWPPL